MIFKDTRLQIAATLGLVALISLIRFFSAYTFLTLIIIIISGQLIEALFTYLTKRKYFFSYSALVTALLVFLLFATHLPLWIYIFALTLAISSKYTLKISQHHIFNPAALGIFVTSLITKQPVSWWGASWIWFLPLIIIFGSFSVLKRLRRLYIVGGFIIIYILFTFLSTSTINLSVLIDGTVILFSFIMLPEPLTSPIRGHWLKTFGIFIGLLMVIIVKILPAINIDPLLLAILSGDLLSFLFINKFPQSV